jgi:hypothetical protein
MRSAPRYTATQLFERGAERCKCVQMTRAAIRDVALLYAFASRCTHSHYSHLPLCSSLRHFPFAIAFWRLDLKSVPLRVL